MSAFFVVEEAGCESCAALVRRAVEALAAVESIEVDEAADVVRVRLSEAASENDVASALAGASEGAGHAYRIKPGSWRAS